MTGTLFRRVLFGLVALFLAAPLIVIAGVSVNAQRTLVFPPVGFSMRWYGAVFTDAAWRGSTRR